MLKLLKETAEHGLRAQTILINGFNFNILKENI